MNRPHILFIDDGVDTFDFTFNINYDYEILEKNKNFELQKRDIHLDTISHGTICASIVKKYYPNFICSSLKVLGSKNKKCNIHILCKAVEWCLTKDFDIINMSLGTVDIRDSKKLINLINMLSKKTTLVSAISNKTLITYPSSFSNVIGVRCTNINHESDLIYCDNSIYGANFFAKGIHELQTKNGYTFKTDNVNSFAAPYVTSLIAKNKLYKKHIHKIISILSGCSQINFSSPDYLEKPLVVSPKLKNFDSTICSCPCIFDINEGEKIQKRIKRIDDDTTSVVFIYDNTVNKKQKIYFNKIALESEYDISIIDMSDKPVLLKYIELNKHYTYYSRFTKPNYDLTVAGNFKIPILKLTANTLEDLMSICHSLYNVFINSDYFPCIVLDNPIAYLLGYFYMNPSDKNSKNYLYELQRTKQANVIIYGTTEYNKSDLIFKSCPTPDLIININSKKYEKTICIRESSRLNSPGKFFLIDKYTRSKNFYIAQIIINILEGREEYE